MCRNLFARTLCLTLTLTLTLNPRYNLDGDEAPVAIRLMRFATAATVRGGVPGRDSLLTLCPLMRLVATLHHRTHDSNDEIEAMLGCPLALCPPERVWETQQSDLPAECEIAAMNPAEAEAVCLSVLHAVGWIREMLNAFTYESLTSSSRLRDAELNDKLLLRIRNLISLQVRLCPAASRRLGVRRALRE